MNLTALLLSRLQFAFTISFHIIFPSFTIGLAAWLTILEALHLGTGRSVLAANEGQPPRERLTLIRIFEELHGRGYEGSYDAVRRYTRRRPTPATPPERRHRLVNSFRDRKTKTR
jgi:Cytochrome bd terminal oxidase subunit I